MARLLSGAVPDLEAWLEHDRFVTRVRGRIPWATWTLAAILAAVFGIGHLWGAAEYPNVLPRMGALVATRVHAGELWRLGSCTFLHAGVLHLVLNGWVVVTLGGLIERVLGPGRMVVLYGVSALAGSAASAVASRGLWSVGSSGGLFGLLAAITVLVWRPAGLLPRAALPRARRVMLLNLGMAIGISFLPRVDAAAHFGGAVAGALLIATGALVRGVPTLQGPDRPGRSAGVPALVTAAAMLGCLAIALAGGRAWTLGDAPAFTARTVGPLGVVAEVPEQLDSYSVQERDGGATEALFGEIVMDPARIAISRFELEAAVPEAALPREIRELTKVLSRPPEGARLAAGPRDELVAGRPGLSVEYAYPSGVILERFVVIGPRALWRVEAFRWPEYAAWGDVSRRVIVSLRPIE